MLACPPVFIRGTVASTVVSTVEIPQPPPDVIPLPPTPHPAPGMPPQIIDPIPPGVGEPVREPGPAPLPATGMRAWWQGRGLP